jgi:hypothetical protein
LTYQKMNDKMITMTQTEKQYSKHIGKLFWCGERSYESDKQEYVYYFNLVMINGVQRHKYSKKFQYRIEVLSSGYRDNTPYMLDCSWFKNLLGKINKYGNGYFPVKTGEVEKDVAQIHKAC